MAILLIKASGHWMDKLTPEEIQARAVKNPGFLDSYNARVKKGDIAEVREDDCKFGNKECLPDFLVIKVPGTKTENMHLMEPETETKHEMVFDEKTMESKAEPYEKTLLRRKYKFDIEKEVSVTRLDDIQKSEKILIDTYDTAKIVDKTQLAVKG